MSPVRTSARERRERAYRRHLRRELARLSELAEQRLREAVLEGLIAGRIEANGEIIIEIDAPPPATRRT